MKVGTIKLRYLFVGSFALALSFSFIVYLITVDRYSANIANAAGGTPTPTPDHDNCSILSYSPDETDPQIENTTYYISILWQRITTTGGTGTEWSSELHDAGTGGTCGDVVVDSPPGCTSQTYSAIYSVYQCYTSPPPPAPVCTLTANPSSGYAPLSGTLTWTTTNSPTTCTATGGWTGSKSTSGDSQGYGPVSSTTTYNLECSNGSGSGACQAVVTIATPTPPPPAICNLTVSPASGVKPVSGTITWTTSNYPTSCTGTSTPNDNTWSTGQGSSKNVNGGSQAFGPDQNTTTYYLTCNNANGGSPCSTTVTVIPTSSQWKTPKHEYPLVDFTWSPANPLVNKIVQFTDQTIFYDSGVGAGNRSWRWDFQSDGSIDSTDQNPSHTFTIAGNYNTNLEATDKDGYTCNRTKIVPVTAGTPVWKEVSPK